MRTEIEFSSKKIGKGRTYRSKKAKRICRRINEKFEECIVIVALSSQGK